MFANMYSTLATKKAPTKREASTVLRQAVYALVSTHCCASAFHACPVAHDIDASLLWLSHPSAEANGAERTRANSDAVRVFIAFSLFFLEMKYPEIVSNQGTQCHSV